MCIGVCVCIIRMKPILDIRELVISCFLSVCAYTRAHARTHAFFSLAVFNLPSLISFSYNSVVFLYVHIFYAHTCEFISTRIYKYMYMNSYVWLDMMFIYTLYIELSNDMWQPRSF